MTPADELRAAATLLRERAAKATSGPWADLPYLGGDVYIKEADGSYRFIAQTARHDDAFQPDDACWIATMHPGLAEPLAAWLEVEAEIADGNSDTYPLACPESLGVARVILGGER